jgi:hypothetical protein
MMYDMNTKTWEPIFFETSFPTNVCLPINKDHIGLDIVTNWAKSTPECSPFSCNGLSKEVEINEYCLCNWDVDKIIRFISNHQSDIGEPGPYKIYKVYKIAQQGDAPELASLAR